MKRFVMHVTGRLGVLGLGAILATGVAPAWAQTAATPEQVPPPATVTRPAPVAAPKLSPTLRMSFYTNTARLSSNAGFPEQTSSEYITSITFASPDGPGGGVDYVLDMRHAQPTAAHREARLSLYDAYVGARFAGGAWRARGGQMWITDLGGLGAVAGGLVEYRQVNSRSPLGQFRAGGFGGIEPRTYDFGYLRNIRKLGGYAALEGGAGRRHTVGYVRVDHDGLAERSVVTVGNFVPAPGRVFVYQAAEIDLRGPAGQGSGGLTYLFVNARVAPAQSVEVQGIFNRGRSVDARTITEDVLNGRPVPTSSLDGLLYESVGARVTVEVMSRFRVHGGYTRDRNNHDSAPTGRLTFGAYTPDLAGTGFDIAVSNSRIDRPTGRYNSLYLSGGRQLGRSVYLSADYTTSVSVVRFTRSDGFTVEMRPATRQLGTSAVVSLGRHFTGHVSFSDTRDDETHEYRVLAGLTLRR